MPPRTPAAVANSMWNLSSLLGSLPSTSTRPTTLTKCSACLFSSSAHLESIKKKRHKKKSQDPYRAAQAKLRKTANLARQATLQAQRQASLGDPVRSSPTPFIQSIKNPQAAGRSSSSTSSSSSPQSNSSSSIDNQYLNFFLEPKSVANQLSHSKWLTEPIAPTDLATTTSVLNDAEAYQYKLDQHDQAHQNAERALQSITSLKTGSSKDRTRMNVQRCIAEFGRHNTDNILPPKPVSLPATGSRARPPLSESEAAAAAELAAIPKRVGADTGSSEVQIAILTVKINTLADNLGRKDNHNKRNLRLLVHRRQKLLNYLRRKERGGPRWANLVEKLGINDAMWKGEISLP